jgi:hypothetical protein
MPREILMMRYYTDDHYRTSFITVSATPHAAIGGHINATSSLYFPHEDSASRILPRRYDAAWRAAAVASSTIIHHGRRAARESTPPVTNERCSPIGYDAREDNACRLPRRYHVSADRNYMPRLLENTY